MFRQDGCLLELNKVFTEVGFPGILKYVTDNIGCRCSFDLTSLLLIRRRDS
jgi:hypothetical protein